jgi:hypothetical protein
MPSYKGAKITKAPFGTNKYGGKRNLLWPPEVLFQKRTKTAGLRNNNSRLS